MKILENLRVRTRLIIAFGIAIAITVCMGAIGYINLKSISDLTITLLKKEGRLAEYAAHVRANVHALRQYEKDSFINIHSKKEVKSDLRKWNMEYNSAMEKIVFMENIAYNDDDQKSVINMKSDLNHYKAGFMDVYNRIIKGNIKKTVQANNAMNKHKKYIQRLATSVRDFSYKCSEQMHSIESTIKNRSRSLFRNILIIVAASIIFSLLVIKLFMSSLKQTVIKIMDSSDNLLSSSIETRDSSTSLSDSSNEIASSIEETTSTLEELNVATIQNLSNSKNTGNIARESVQKASDGRNAVHTIVDSIKTISEKISVIQEIAGQTNLLAVNAAIEAARAGEHGKGFSVVASEVRELAKKSQVAAKNISELIKDITQKSTSAGLALDDIVAAINNTSNLVQEITLSSDEQNTGFNQITKAVNKINEATEQNAAFSEELSSTAVQLAEQANQLKSSISIFGIRK